ncbi:hypothetical protein Q5752_004713 [Cryptotrichosporon argae]
MANVPLPSSPPSSPTLRPSAASAPNLPSLAVETDLLDFSELADALAMPGSTRPTSAPAKRHIFRGWEPLAPLLSPFANVVPLPTSPNSDHEPTFTIDFGLLDPATAAYRIPLPLSPPPSPPPALPVVPRRASISGTAPVEPAHRITVPRRTPLAFFPPTSPLSPTSRPFKPPAPAYAPPITACAYHAGFPPTLLSFGRPVGGFAAPYSSHEYSALQALTPRNIESTGNVVLAQSKPTAEQDSRLPTPMPTPSPEAIKPTALPDMSAHPAFSDIHQDPDSSRGGGWVDPGSGTVGEAVEYLKTVLSENSHRIDEAVAHLGDAIICSGRQSRMLDPDPVRLRLRRENELLSVRVVKAESESREATAKLLSHAATSRELLAKVDALETQLADAGADNVEQVQTLQAENDALDARRQKYKTAWKEVNQRCTELQKQVLEVEARAATKKELGPSTIYVLLEGEARMFDPAYVEQSEDGGIRMAEKLLDWVREEYAVTSGRVSSEVSIVVTLYIDLDEAINDMISSRLISNGRTFRRFLDGFMSADGLINIIDVMGANGPLSKVRAQIRILASLSSTAMILLGSSRASKYVALLDKLDASHAERVHVFKSAGTIAEDPFIALGIERIHTTPLMYRCSTSAWEAVAKKKHFERSQAFTPSPRPAQQIRARSPSPPPEVIAKPPWITVCGKPLPGDDGTATASRAAPSRSASTSPTGGSYARGALLALRRNATQPQRLHIPIPNEIYLGPGESPGASPLSTDEDRPQLVLPVQATAQVKRPSRYVAPDDDASSIAARSEASINCWRVDRRPALAERMSTPNDRAVSQPVPGKPEASTSYGGWPSSGTGIFATASRSSSLTVTVKKPTLAHARKPNASSTSGKVSREKPPHVLTSSNATPIPSPRWGASSGMSKGLRRTDEYLVGTAV